MGYISKSSMYTTNRRLQLVAIFKNILLNFNKFISFQTSLRNQPKNTNQFKIPSHKYTK